MKTFNGSKNKEMVPISVAAEILEISIDTVRRWDKKGILHSRRVNNKTRYFLVDELEQIKSSKPLTISEVSWLLRISTSTLRRLEKKDLIKAQRNASGERIYTKRLIEQFIKSDYFLRQRVMTEKAFERLEKLKGLY